MRVLFAGGGTGGHINPAISIADYAAKQDKDFKALFVVQNRDLKQNLYRKQDMILNISKYKALTESIFSEILKR